MKGAIVIEDLKKRDMQQYFDGTTRMGMVASALLTIWVNIDSADLMKTGILAAVGAVVSFVVSQVLKMVVRWFRK